MRAEFQPPGPPPATRRGPPGPRRGPPPKRNAPAGTATNSLPLPPLVISCPSNLTRPRTNWCGCDNLHTPLCRLSQPPHTDPLRRTPVTRGSPVWVVLQGERPGSWMMDGSGVEQLASSGLWLRIWAREVVSSAGSRSAARWVHWARTLRMTAERPALELGGLRNPGAGDVDWATITTRGRLSGTM
jgi:hypothetical protein